MNPRIKTNLHDPNPWAPPTFPTSTCRYFCWNIELGFFPQVLILSPKMTTFSALFRSFFALFWAWFLFPFLLFEGGRGRYRETERERETSVLADVKILSDLINPLFLSPLFLSTFSPSHHPCRDDPNYKDTQESAQYLRGRSISRPLFGAHLRWSLDSQGSASFVHQSFRHGNATEPQKVGPIERFFGGWWSGAWEFVLPRRMVV